MNNISVDEIEKGERKLKLLSHIETKEIKNNQNNEKNTIMNKKVYLSKNDHYNLFVLEQNSKKREIETQQSEKNEKMNQDNEYNESYKELKKIYKHKTVCNVNECKEEKILSLLNMPIEILLRIFYFLEKKDLYVLLTVCSEFANLIVEILWFRPNMQNDKSFNLIKEVMSLPRNSTHWDYRLFIKRLNLSFMTSLVDDDLLTKFIGCPKLERLTLVNCTKLTYKPITQVLNNCQYLQSLDLTGVIDIHDDIINALAENCFRLQGLYVPGCLNVSEAAIFNLLDSCPMLKRIKFNNSTHITDNSILKIYQNCKSLVEIDLHNCPNVTDKYIKLIFLELLQLREFRISNSLGITDALFYSILKDVHLEKLRVIDLTGCNSITDKLIENLIVSASRLRNVVLSKCMQITDASLRSLSQLGRCLHYVHLGHCGLITDFGVASLVRSCHRIQYIDLACCSQLTDWSIVELANLPKLKRIGLVKCSLITDNGILELVRRRGEQDCLERVHLSYCTNLTIGPIYLLLKSCPRLTHLSLTGISSFLRKEITQFCRDPPPDFNDHQRSLFCVFSGQGINHLRNHFNQIMEERAFMINQNDIHTLFLERRRRLTEEDFDANNEINIWLRRDLNNLQQNVDESPNFNIVEINTDLIREISQGNVNPHIRDQFQRIFQNRHQQLLLDHYNQNHQQQIIANQWNRTRNQTRNQTQVINVSSYSETDNQIYTNNNNNESSQNPHPT